MSHSLLLADDSPTIAKILQMALQNEPYTIRSVLTAEDALKELSTSPPFFFLIDLNLPIQNGYELARLVRRDPKLNEVRVVLLASAFEPVDEAEYAACGADGLVKKPFDPSELRSKLRTLAEAPARAAAKAAEVVPVPAAEDAVEEPVVSADAEAILATLISNQEEVSEPPSTLPFTEDFDPLLEEFRQDVTITLDLNSSETANVVDEEVLDLSGSFDSHPDATAVLDLSEQAEPDRPPPAPRPRLPIEKPGPIPPAEDPLSSNAQALAAFFDAELHENGPPPSPAVPPERPTPQPKKESPPDENIDWNAGPPPASLKEWSSKGSSTRRQDPEPPPPFSPPPAKPKPVMASSSKDVPPAMKPPLGAKAVPPPTPTPPRGDSNLLFDTGDSTFRFSEDYIQRISKSFTGDFEETAPESAPPVSVFPRQSDDRLPPKIAPVKDAPPPTPPRPAVAANEPPRAGGGAWSDGEVQKIESIVREEVQMVVREVAEKIAWEVIPELAENIIRKELEKVLKDLGQ